MSLNDEERQIVVNLEKEKALNTFAEIAILRQVGLWNNIANRLYYAAFHAVSALLINDHHHIGSHQGAVIVLHQFYEKSDYNCTYYATEEDTAPRIEQTKQFIDKVLGLIQ